MATYARRERERASGDEGPQHASSARPLRVGREPVRFQLEVGRPGDAVERDADRMAASRAPVGTAISASSAGGAESAPPALESGLRRLRANGGRRLPPAARETFETRYGTDFEDVRVHDDAAAHDLAKSVGARAFTVGSDVVFAEGEYAPGTDRGERLLGHELAHVVQQQNGAPERVQRALPTDAALAERKEFPKSDGQLSDDGRTIVFDTIQIPDFKYDEHRRRLYDQRIASGHLIRWRNYQRGNPNQARVWNRHLRGESRNETIKERLIQKLREAYQLETIDERRSPWGTTWGVEYPSSLEETGRRASRGRIPTLVRNHLQIPKWTRTGAPRPMDVDHVVELQLGNWGGSDRWANTIDNMELLWSPANQSSGSTIDGQQMQLAVRHIEAWKAAVDDTSPVDQQADARALFARYALQFEGVSGAAIGSHSSIGTDDFWKLPDVIAAEHMGPVVASDTSFAGGAAGAVRIFLAQGDQETVQEMRWDGRRTEAVDAGAGDRDATKSPLQVVSKRFFTGPDWETSHPTQLGSLWVNAPQGGKSIQPFDEPREVSVDRVQGARFAGRLNVDDLLEAVRAVESEGMSPVTFSSLRFDAREGVQGTATVDAEYADGSDTSFVEGDQGKPELTIDGSGASFDGDMPADAIDPPGPIQIVSSTISFSGDDDTGPRVDGSVEVDILDIAHGNLTASIEENGFAVEGELTAEGTYFRSATVRVGYDSEEGVSGGATLVLDTSRVPGLEEGSVTVEVDNAVWTVAGSAHFSAFGMEGDLTVSWAEDSGVTVAGRIPIGEGQIPGISGGHIEGRVTRTPEGELRFGAEGQVRPSIPGLESQIDASWDDGIFNIRGTVGMTHENLAGEVRVGVTNQEVGEDGEPTGEPGDELLLFGGGSLDVTFGEYIRGRADVDLTPAGEMVVRGTIGLADELELFPRREVERRLFGLDIEIPIVGITVAGRGFGIFAFIGGGLDASAGFGPGVLRDTEASVTFNPARPQDTVLDGSAELFVPADAGLRLFVRAGVGGSLAIADVRGGLEIGGALGVEGHARARVDVEWTPTSGLSVDALAEAIARPVFRFDLTGFVEVNVVLIGTVWEKRWQLAGFDLGSSLEFGVRLPLEFREGEPLSISMDDVELIVPDIDTDQLLEDLFERTT